VFQSVKKDDEIEHCVVTILCKLKSEKPRKKYLSLTRSTALPKKASFPSCIRVTQTVLQNIDKIKVL
jgi:hypothetical protein